MNSTLPAVDHVPRWPHLQAAVRSDGSGSLTINGTEHACRADDADALRAGIIARCTQLADRLHRPVRLSVEDGDNTWSLAIRPQGIVQALTQDDAIPAAAGLSVYTGNCRRCQQPQPITATDCAVCGTREPHRVEAQCLGYQYGEER